MNNPLLENLKIPIPPYHSIKPQIKLVSSEASPVVSEKKENPVEQAAELMKGINDALQAIKEMSWKIPDAMMPDDLRKKIEDGIDTVQGAVKKGEEIARDVAAIYEATKNIKQAGETFGATIGERLKANGQKLPTSSPKPETEAPKEVAEKQTELPKQADEQAKPRVEQKTDQKEPLDTPKLDTPKLDTPEKELASIRAALSRPENQKDKGLISRLQAQERGLMGRIRPDYAEQEKPKQDSSPKEADQTRSPESQARAIKELLKHQERSLEMAIKQRSPDDNIQRIKNNIAILRDALEKVTTQSPVPKYEKRKPTNGAGVIREVDAPAELRGEMDDLKRRREGQEAVEVEPTVVSTAVAEPAPSVPSTQTEGSRPVESAPSLSRESRPTNLGDASEQELIDELERRKKNKHIGWFEALKEKIKVNVKATYESLPQAVTMAFHESWTVRAREDIERLKIESNLHKAEKKRLEEQLASYEKKKKSPSEYTPQQQKEIANGIVHIQDQIKKEEAAIMKFDMKLGEHEIRRDKWEDRRNRAVDRYASRIDSAINGLSQRKTALEQAFATETNPRKKQQIRKSIYRINKVINPWKLKRDIAEKVTKKPNKSNG